MGEMAEEMADGARKSGLPAGAVIVAADHEEILADLLETVNRGDFILVKGSRGMGMDRVAEGLRRRFAGNLKEGAVT
jgi:UDP-N-acetylmuramoyl-tripeptide--D-alanyl-D-alanine ligase